MSRRKLPAVFMLVTGLVVQSGAQIPFQAAPPTAPVAPSELVPATGIQSEGPLTVKGFAGMMLGNVTYDVGGIVDGVTWASELEFPLDMVVGGLDASLRWGAANYYAQGVLGVRVLGNLTDPVSDMEDRDWVPRTYLYSYTESEAELEALMINAYLKVPFYTGRGMFMARNTSLYFVGEYSHQEFNYDIYGLTGWYDEHGPGGLVQQYEPKSTHALTYDVTFDSLAIGGEIVDHFGEAFQFTGAMLAGLGWYDDRDDHLLRAKLSESDGVGVVFTLRGSSRYIFDAYSSGLVKWFVEGMADLTAFAASGTQEQHFYDGSDGNYYRVDEDISSIQLTGAFALGCMF